MCIDKVVNVSLYSSILSSGAPKKKEEERTKCRKFRCIALQQSSITLIIVVDLHHTFTVININDTPIYSVNLRRESTTTVYDLVFGKYGDSCNGQGQLHRHIVL